MKHSVRVSGSIIIILLVLAVCEIMACLVSRYIAQKHGIPFYLPHITKSYEHYQARLNPTLGWPSPAVTTKKSDFYDASGSRRIPAFIDPTWNAACVSLYGDSFTEAEGVDHAHAWSNVLSLLLNCRVANYGVSGYGTDQAYLRYLGNHNDHAKVVILAYLAENIQRNVNQFRNLLGPSPQCIIKPRFIRNSQGQLTLIPIPPLSPKEYVTLQQEPGLIFPHDFFVPGGPAGFQKASFPYLWRIIQTSGILFKRVVWRLQPYQELYQPGDPSQALETTVAIIEAFCRTARERNQQPLILVIPTVADVSRYLRRKGWVYQPLLPLLAERHLEYIDMGPKIIKYLGGANPKTIYDPEIQYHFNEAGNRLLAQVVYDFLTTRNILKR